MRQKSRWLLAAAGVAGLLLVAGLLFSNLVGGETKIERRIERLHALDDPRFMRELGLLLGPPFLPGTQARALVNGDAIFPTMLAAIRAARVSITFETYIARRQTAVPSNQPIGLSEVFANDATKQLQWRAFLKKNKLEPVDLGDVVRTIRVRALQFGFAGT